MADALGDHFNQPAIEIMAVAIVSPMSRRRVAIVMPRAGVGSEPDLIGCGLSAQDKLAAVRELNRHDAVAGNVIDLVGVERFKPFSDDAEAFVSPLQEFVLVHFFICMIDARVARPPNSLDLIFRTARIARQASKSRASLEGD